MKYSIYSVCLILTLVCMNCVMLLSKNAPTLWLFTDLASLSATLLGAGAMLRASWSFREMAACFAALSRERSDRGELIVAARFFADARRRLYYAATVAAFIGTIGIFVNLENRMKYGPNLALALLSLLYAAALDLLLCTPMECAARRKAIRSRIAAGERS